MFAILSLRSLVVAYAYDHSSVSVSSWGIKPLRSLRSLRETYNIITTQMYFFPHAEDAKVAKIYYITLLLEGSPAPHDKRALNGNTQQ